MSKSLENPLVPHSLPNSLVLQPHGGLGNQLFMYFAALYLVRKNEKLLHIDFPFTHKSFGLHTGSIREFELNASISLGSNLARLSVKDSLQSRILSLDHFPKGLKNVIGRRLSHFHSFNLGFSRGLEFASCANFVSGYFQTCRYFDQLTPGDKDLGFDKFLGSALYGSYKREIVSSASTALHVRRGDYLSHRVTYGLLSPEYYKLAVSKLRDFTEVKKLFIFSDSEELLEGSDWKFSGVEVEFVDTRKELTATETLRLMAFAENHIIANSSFSWWGAKMSKRGGVVIAPNEWFRTVRQPELLIPDGWIKSQSMWL